jgi:metal-responsive CopG/Arc/MetJ family transcriptional regulator
MVRAKKQYNVQLEDDVVARIDRLAEKLDLNRSQIMRNMLLIGLDEAEVIDKAGIFSAVIFSRDLLKKFKEAALKGKISLDKSGEIKMTK